MDNLDDLPSPDYPALIAQAQQMAKLHREKAKKLPAKSAAIYIKVAENYERLLLEYQAKKL